MSSGAAPREIAFRFRELPTERLERLSEMFRLCFALETNEAYFRWKYLENPAGKVVAYEALEGDTPAAFYGVIPELWNVDGSVRRIYQSMDTATHPNYQRRGLFAKLATMTYDHIVRQDGHAEIIGFPGPQSFPGFVNKLGWKSVRDVRYIFTSSLMNLMRLRRARDLEFTAVRDAEELSGFFAAERRPQARIAKHITAEILDWRVFRNPLLRYEVVAMRQGGRTVGFCVYRVDTPRSCCIEWLEMDGPWKPSWLAALAAELLARAGRRYVYTWEPEDAGRKRAFRAAGFVHNPFRRGPFTGTLPFIVYAAPAAAESDRWFHAASYDLQPLVHD